MEGADMIGATAVGALIGVVQTPGDANWPTLLQNCSVENCEVEGPTLANPETPSDGFGTGGLIGLIDQRLNVVLSECSSSGSNIFGSYGVGGLLGISSIFSHLTLSDCQNNSGSVVSDFSGAGGLIGTADTLHVFTSTNKADVTGGSRFSSTDTQNAAIGFGGIAGGTGYSFIVMSMNEGNVSGYEGVGGLVGHAEGEITLKSCIVAQVGRGASTIKGGSYVGGFFGYLKGALTLADKNMMYLGISGSGQQVGGIAGYLTNFGMIHLDNIEMDGDVQVTGASCVGGIAGTLINGIMQEEESFWGNTNPWSYGTIADESSYPPHVTAIVGFTNGSSETVGGIIGYMESCTLKYVCAKATVRGKSRGGLVGEALKSTISHAVNRPSSDNEETQSGQTTVLGGIAAKAKNCNVDNLINYENLPQADTIGGVIGHFSYFPDGEDNKVASYCANTGSVEGNRYIGGVFGLIEGNGDKEIIHCGNYGKITGINTSGDESDQSGVGGIAGMAGSHTTLKGCANHGEVKNEGPYHGVGGITGVLGEDPTGAATSNCDNWAFVLECCNFGTLTANNGETRMGGIVGYMEEGCYTDYDRTKIMDCYNAGTVNRDKKELMSNPGGIVGLVDNYAKCQNTVNWGTVNKGNAGMGTHGSTFFWHESMYGKKDTGKDWKCEMLSADEMKKQDSFEGFNFNSIWKLDSGDEYPTLRSCTFQFVK